MIMGCDLSVLELAKQFRVGRRSIRVLNEVSLHASENTVTAIIGPNACGKTTLLRVIAGIISPDSGEVLIDGVPLYSKLRKLRSKIGFVTPTLDFHKKLSMNETLSYFEGIQGSTREDIETFIETMGMSEAMDEKIEGFSEGQKMTLRIGCALMKRPSLLLLDEVTSPMDTDRSEKLIQFLKDYSSRATILMIDHNPKVISRLAEDFVLMRKDGSIMRTGSMRDFFKATSHLYRLRVKTHDSVHPGFWDSFGERYKMGSDGSVSFLLESRKDVDRLMEQIGKYSGTIHSYEASVVTLGDVYEQWIRLAEGSDEEELLIKPKDSG